MPSETINSISPDIRDALLNRNLIPFTNGMSAYGLGQPISIELTYPLASQNVTTIDNNPIVGNASDIREAHTDLNPYKASNGAYEQIDITTGGLVGNSNTDFISDEYIPPTDLSESPLTDPINKFPFGGTTPLKFLSTQNLYGGCNQYEDVSQGLYKLNPISDQICSYLDEKGGIRGLPPTTAYDILGTLLTGRQIGFTPDGPEPNFDIRSSIIGRILAPTIGDTPLGLIGAQSLLNHMLANISSNLQEDTLGRINIHGLFNKNEDLIIPNWEITDRKGFFGNIKDVFENLSGSQLATRDMIGADGSMIDGEDNSETLLDRYTGKGQVNALFFNLGQNESLIKSVNGKDVFISRYTPPYEDKRLLKSKSLPDNIYTTNQFPKIDNTLRTVLSESDNKTNEFSWVKGNQDDVKEGLDQLQLSSIMNNVIGINTGIGKIYGNPFFPFKTSLLYKTQELFNNDNIDRILLGNSHFGKTEKSELQRQISEGNNLISKGSAVMGLHSDNPAEANPFCRTWTTYRRYNQVKNLQKHSGLYDNSITRYRNNIQASVLDDNGFVKISPYIDSYEIKKYMFSIENLAWADRVADLPSCEVGNGDPLNPNIKGRIMWFPPYDISFNDTVSVNWEGTNFIGRGEPIYTYNNTERSGMLSWKIIVDHPSFINEQSYRTNPLLDDNYHTGIFAGCQEIPNADIEIKETIEEEEIELQQEVTVSEQIEPKYFVVYFPNDLCTEEAFNEYLDITKSRYYEDGTSNEGLGTTTAIGGIFAERRTSYPDNTNFGFNAKDCKFRNQPSLLHEIDTTVKELLTSCPKCKIKISGYASKQGQGTNTQRVEKNKQLSQCRAETVKKFIIDKLKSSIPDIENRFSKIEGEGETSPISTYDNDVNKNNIDSLAQKSCRYTYISISYDPKSDENVTPEPKKEKKIKQFKVKSKSQVYNECSYFLKLSHEKPFVYNSIKERIKYFHPAFHSITPEGFNSRLTFLHQCTRQGPSNVGNKPDNLAFGRPPICILRIGDFFYTRIVIDSISFSYEPLVWDLNPEGIGVQPMIVDVDMSFKIIGGQSIQGPINKLQNALSFNFFANTEIYDTRADKINNGNLLEGTVPTNEIETEEIFTNTDNDKKDNSDENIGSIPTENQNFIERVGNATNFSNPFFVNDVNTRLQAQIDMLTNNFFSNNNYY